MAKQEIAKLLLNIKAVSLNPKEGFTYASGRKGPIYCDNRLILSFPNERRQVVDSFIALIKENKLEFDIIAGVATGAIAWGALVAEKLKSPFIYIRGAAKDHGKENLIEGKLEKGNKVLVIEDLINTGGSSVEACKAVATQGGIVTGCIAVFTYGFAEAHKKFEDAKIKLFCLSDFSTLTEVAIDKKYIQSDEKEILNDWHSNPKEWKP